jgi:SpoVK/Ycf46/Vps4 family AAA+-type ATPase
LQTPILKYPAALPRGFFIEADAVIEKRRNLGEDYSGPGQTENAIQNIILQEIEDLNGILIAATNLAQNMDAAFERRFLYKIEFEKPGIETRRAIWEALIPDIAGDSVQELASRFDFSGGQIENITRKITVHQVLHGVMPSSEDITRFCCAEHWGRRSANKIGFTS